MGELIEFIERTEPLYRHKCLYKPTFDELKTLAPKGYHVILNPQFGRDHYGRVEGRIIYVYKNPFPDVELSVLIHELTHAYLHDNGPCDNIYWHKREAEANAVEHLMSSALDLKYDLTTEALNEYDFNSYRFRIDYSGLIELVDYFIDYILSNLAKIEHITTETFISDKG